MLEPTLVRPQLHPGVLQQGLSQMEWDQSLEQPFPYKVWMCITQGHIKLRGHAMFVDGSITAYIYRINLF